MKAAVYEQYGPPEVVEIRDVTTPAPKDGEVRIQTRAATVSSGDRRMRSLDVPAGFGLMVRLAFGLSKPRQPVLGTELSGIVDGVGKNVRGFKPGDEVFAFADAPAMGCHAEYRCVPETKVVPRPASLTWEQAAALSFGGKTALAFLRKGNVRRGDRVLVNGASGSVGTACVQLARHLGAEVTAVCSGANAELVRSLGAAHVVDYTRDDFTKNGQSYDVIIDTAGTAPYARVKHSLADRGRLLLVIATLGQMLGGVWVSATSQKKVITIAPGRPEDLRHLAELAEKGSFTPVVDRTFPLEEIVEAHRYVDTGHKRGNVVVTFAPSSLPRVAKPPAVG